MPQDILATCDGCDKRFLIKHTLSFPNSGLVLARHDDDAKEWGALRDRDLVSFSITYKPKINSKKIQGERNEAGARQDIETSKGGADTVGEAQGGSGSGRTVNVAAALEGRLGKVQVPSE